MFSPSKLLSLFAVSVVALMLSEGSACWASLMVPPLPEFIADHVADSGDMSPESANQPAEENVPTDSPLNPIRLTARKGLMPSGSSSSSSSTPSPTSGASSSVLCDIAIDPVALAHDEQCARLYAETADFIPNAVHARLFRPPRLS